MSEPLFKHWPRASISPSLSLSNYIYSSLAGAQGPRLIWAGMRPAVEQGESYLPSHLLLNQSSNLCFTRILHWGM